MKAVNKHLRKSTESNRREGEGTQVSGVADTMVVDGHEKFLFSNENK